MYNIYFVTCLLPGPIQPHKASERQHHVGMWAFTIIEILTCIWLFHQWTNQTFHAAGERFSFGNTGVQWEALLRAILWSGCVFVMWKIFRLIYRTICQAQHCALYNYIFRCIFFITFCFVYLLKNIVSKQEVYKWLLQSIITIMILLVVYYDYMHLQ